MTRPNCPNGPGQAVSDVFKNTKFRIFIALVCTLLLALNGLTAWQASNLVHHPAEKRRMLRSTDANAGYTDVVVETSDGLTLHGWYIPSRNSALILMQHGYKSDRAEFHQEAAMLARAGYGVLVTSVRAHDVNPGDTITFGIDEMQDIDAWFNFGRTLPGVDPDRIGMIGNSLGGSMAIQYTAANTGIRALVAHCAFSSMHDTIETSIRSLTGLPPFPFAPMIQFWAEMQLGISIDEINASAWIGQISPRPVLILNALDDTVISPASGQLLYAAAGEPKQLWEEHGVRHAGFDTAFPEAFERRVVGFFDAVLFPDASTGAEQPDTL